MTDMVTMLLILGAGWYAYKNGMLDDLVEQLKGVDLGGGGTAPVAPVPEATPVPEAAPAEPAEGGGEAAPAEPATAGGGGGNCKCMPMDSDPNRFKIETPDGVDCANHEYPPSMAECEALLKTVAGSACCGGGGGGGATPAATEGGGEDKAAEGGGDKGGDKKKKSNYARSCTDYTPMNWA